MIDTLRRIGQRLRRDERGASLVEYALLMALIAVVCFSALTYFGRGSGNSLENSKCRIESAHAGDGVGTGC